MNAGQSDFQIQPDVRAEKYIGKCPGCGRVRLELFVDGQDDVPRAVGIQCEKCRRQWLLDPTSADYFSEYDDRNPLEPGSPENNPFGGADA